MFVERYRLLFGIDFVGYDFGLGHVRPANIKIHKRFTNFNVTINHVHGSIVFTDPCVLRCLDTI